MRVASAGHVIPKLLILHTHANPPITTPRPLKIYKFSLSCEITILTLPVGYKVITARYQNSAYGQGLKLWVLCDSNAKEVKVTFVAQNTGSTIIDPAEYIATAEAPDGEMFHIFELK